MTSVNHMHFFLHLPSSGYHEAAGKSSLAASGPALQDPTQIPCRKSSNQGFPNTEEKFKKSQISRVRQSSLLPAVLSTIGNRDNILVQNAHSGSNNVTFFMESNVDFYSRMSNFPARNQ